MRRAGVILFAALSAIAAFAAENPQRPSQPQPQPQHCCVDKVYDKNGKLFGDVVKIETNHGVSMVDARYTLKGGDDVILYVSPWYVMSDTQPGGSNVVFTSPDCSGDAFVTLTPQLTKRQAVVLPKAVYPTWTATEAWLYVSDPFPTPSTGTIPTVFHSQWDNGACSPYPAPGFTFSGTIFGGVWMHRVEDLYKKYARPFWIP